MAEDPAAAAEGARKGTDPLKLYCLIFLLLSGLLGVLYLKRSSSRKAIEAANVSARTWFDTKQGRNAREDRPNDIPGLAFEIEQMVEAYVAAGGEDASKISDTFMKGFAAKAGMVEFQVGQDQTDPNKGRGYVTLMRRYEYQPATMENLLALAFNIDGSLRYRVQEMSFVLTSKKDGNTTPPNHKVNRSVLKVALRKALRPGE